MKTIANIISNSSFDFWKSDGFKTLVNFDNIPQEEQDRIFNELEVSLVGLFVLKYSHLENQMIEGFIELMAEVGIEHENLITWRKLIALRLKEYSDHYQQAIIETKKFKLLKEKETRIIWSRIETVSIDCLTHIRRGDINQGDPLWKVLREWFMMMDLVFEKILNDSKIKIQLGKS